MREALLDLTSRIHRDFRFDSKVTTVRTPTEEVFSKRRGVCQDFAHVQIACLRSIHSDVSPLRGLILGGGNSTLKVEVDMEPIEDLEPELQAGSGGSTSMNGLTENTALPGPGAP